MHAPLQTKPEENKSDTRAHSSAHNFGAASGFPLFLQTKLTVNQPGDVFEQEADRVAHAATGAPHTCTGCAASGDNGHKCPGCEEADKKVQLKRLPGAGAGGPAGHASLDISGGSPLSPQIRGRVEPLLGYDLGHVRVHTDAGARESAAALQAKAFTHQNHIWLRGHESADDIDLMAHETTHVVQQGVCRAPSHFIQRRETTTDGEAPKARLFSRIEEETGEKIASPKPNQAAPTVSGGPAPAAPSAVGAAPASKRPKPTLTKEQQEARSKIDPAEKQGKRRESEADARPDIDRPGETRPKAETAARETRQKVDEPPKPIAGEKEAADKKKEKGKDKGKKAGPVHAAPGEAAFAAADSVPQPDGPPAVIIPPPVMPVDAAGQPLLPNPASDAKVASLATEAQLLRDEGLRLRQAAAEMRGNAHALRGNMQIVSSGVGNAEAINAAFHDNSKFRHEAAGLTDTGLQISDQKAATVAEQAPGGVERANEEKKKSGEVSGEATSLAGESANQDADDEDAGAKAQENAGKMNKVAGDIGTIDNAVGQAQSAATALVKDAAHAKTVNAAAHTKHADTHAVLAQTDAKLEQMDAHNAAARGQLADLASGPDELLAQAQALDDQGRELIETSQDIEKRLAQSQDIYAQAMKSIPKEEEETETEAATQSPAEEGVSEPGPEAAPVDATANKEIDLTEDLPEWLTGEKKPSEEERERAYQENEARRQAEIKEIEGLNKDGFGKLTAGDKFLMALRLTGRNLFGGISKITWPGWGKVGAGAAKLVIGLFDPRSALTGALGGVNMIVNASVQFFKQPTWGGLLKLAADIATGITIILGSIVALAGVIAAIMTAITILSFGLAAPITGPVIAFCATVMSVVGGWTFWAGLVALELQALVFLKDLYAASTAKTADELQKAADAMSTDAKNAGNAAMQAGMGKLAQFGGRKMQAEIADVGSENFARNLAKKSLLGEAGEGFKGGGGLKGFGKALGKGITKRAKGAVRQAKAIKRAVAHPVETIKDIRAAMKAAKAAPKPEPVSLREGFSKDFLVGPGREAKAAAAAESKAASAVKLGEEVHPPPKPAEKLTPGAGEGVEVATTPPEGPPAREASVRDSQHIDSQKLSDRQLRNETTHLSEHPEKIEGTPPNRHAKLGDHEWVEQPGGEWCRFSSLKVCVNSPELRAQALQDAQKKVAGLRQEGREARQVARSAKATAAAARSDVQRIEQRINSARAEARSLREEADQIARGGLDKPNALKNHEAALELAKEQEELAVQAEKDLARAREEARSAGRAETRAGEERRVIGGEVHQAQLAREEQERLVRKIEELEAKRTHLLENPQGGTQLQRTRWVRTPETEALQREIDALERRLADEIERARGVTPEVSEYLRRATPSREASREVMKNLPHGLKGPTGQPIDVITLAELKPGEYEIDHIWPKSRIESMEGFNRLTLDQMREVMNLPENLMPLRSELNASKLNLTMEEWFSKPLGKQVPPWSRVALLAAQERGRQAVEQAIARFLKIIIH